MSVYQARYYLTCLEKEGKIKRTPPRRGACILWVTESVHNSVSR
nr:FaeA/PapI family transcriptional regulator [Escherichia coli]